MDTFYITQVRTAEGEWVKFTTATTALDAAYSLTDALQIHGARPSELHGLRDDLAQGHILTMDDGFAMRVLERQPVVNPDAPKPQDGLDRCRCGAKYWDGFYCASCGALTVGPDFMAASTESGHHVSGRATYAGSSDGRVEVQDEAGLVILAFDHHNALAAAETIRVALEQAYHAGQPVMA